MGFSRKTRRAARKKRRAASLSAVAHPRRRAICPYSASSASDTKSNEDPTWGNGAFTKALVEAFNGAAKQATDEGLSTQQLEMYLYKEVRKTTNFKQSPVFMNPNGMEHFNIFTYEN